jgi:hypothetical protein
MNPQITEDGLGSLVLGLWFVITELTKTKDQRPKPQGQA